MTSKWKLKACPRCEGDVYIELDGDGWYETCLQCSYRRPLKTVAEAAARYWTGRETPPFQGVDTPERRQARGREKRP